MPLIFLGGAHGAGKSSLARTMGDVLKAKVLSASRLIHEEGVDPSTTDKRVVDIGGNQERLLQGLCRYDRVGSIILLDGHFCLRSEQGAPAAVPLETFRRMAPDALLLLVDEPVTIAQRLKERDGVIHLDTDITALQECEYSTAQLVSLELGIELCIVRPPQAADSAMAYLKRRIG